MRKFLTLFFIVIAMSFLGAMGPDVSRLDGKNLKWEEGAWDYFTMFKTLLRNDNRIVCTPTQFKQCELGNDQPGNPQADACVDPAVGSTFTLIGSQIPSDARVKAAYLIWVSALPSEKVPNGDTDNTVTLSFANQNKSVTLRAEISATDKPRKVGDPQDFSFGSNESVSPANLACTTDEECTSNVQLGAGWKCIVGKCSTHTVVYTYRADVTEFFDTIHEMSTAEGITNEGIGLLGDYTVSDMECTNDPAYLTTSGMVGGWSLVFVYTSEQISPKKIYIYDGFEAYRFEEGVISTSGFELPNEAVVRFTMISAEGDPGLASSQNPDSPFGPPPPAEGLYISGAQKFPLGEWLQLWNDCNQSKATDSTGLPFNYTEVFNSISSTYGWDDETPFCVGGNPGMVDPNLLEYALDVDTFIMSAKDEAFAPHLIKGDQFLNFKIGTNQDQIYTNMIVVSIDTKAPKFDIPKNPETPDGREKNSCTCAKTDDFICTDRPFYFTIKVENWGENIAEKVTVSDTLPKNVTYIAGSTEMLTTKDGVTGKWEKVDDVSGSFPFATATKVMDSMYYCDQSTFECRDKVMIRFKVKPVDGIQKNETIDNTAIITDTSGVQYFSNSSIPLRLKQGDCPPITECPEPPKEECGPTSGPECVKKEDCEDGYVCTNEKCVKNTESITKNAVITFAKGKNNPSAEDSSIIISNPSKNLVVGQFTLMAEEDKGKSFNLNGINIDIFSNTSGIMLSKFRLIYDENGDGEAGSKEKVIATLETAKAKVVSFSVLNESDRSFESGKLHYFIVVMDAEISGVASNNDNFNIEIKGPESFLVSDNGKPEVKGQGFNFATFKFEPANGFIVTKGENDAEVPSIDKMNGIIPVLQLRTKSMQGDDTLKSIGFKPYLKSVKLGEGINGAVLYHDKNSDGKIDSGDIELAKISSFESLTNGMFTNLGIKYAKGEEKHLLIALNIKLTTGQIARIQIGSGKVVVTPDRDIVELPVTSKEFKYECPEGDPTCSDVDDESSGCSISTVENTTTLASIIMLLLIAASGLFSSLVFKNR